MRKLQTCEISKSYNRRKVVDDVSVLVEQGEVVGLLGPNGAGKTTSFHMIVGLMSPDSGKVLLDEEEITSLPMYQRARKGISYLPQEPSVFRKLTVEENLLAILETLASERAGRAGSACTASSSSSAWRRFAQQELHAVGRGAAAGGDRPVAGDRADVPPAGRAVQRDRSRSRCWSCSGSSST